MKRYESLPTPDAPASGSPLHFASLEELRTAAGGKTQWLWHGYLAAGGITLLTGQWKAGKSTLLAALLGRMKKGGKLAGLAVTASRAAVVSEEGPDHWLRRADRFDLAGHVRWLCRPFTGRPTPAQWQELLDGLAQQRRTEGTDLFVLDPLASFLPGHDENSAAGLLDALLPLSTLTREGAAVLLLHHPRKGERSEGQLARGSGALSGFVDVRMEMSWLRAPSASDRRRCLRAWSRYEETPRQLVVELDASGTEVRACGDEEQAELAEGWKVLRTVLRAAPFRLTRQEVRERWPADGPIPSSMTVWRWLELAKDQGKVVRTGKGRRGCPFRYALPGRTLSDDMPELPPLAEELGITVPELIKIEFKHLQKVLKLRQLEAEK